MGFGPEYWKQNYASPSDMDGIGNAKDHALYLKYYFQLSDFQVHSVIDFGFGLGSLFKAILKVFTPYRAYGIEPSEFAYKQVQKKWSQWPPPVKYKLEQKNLAQWASGQQNNAKWFDLGICSSVFQYLTPQEIKDVLPVIAKQCKYLYFSVPTDIELERQRQELDFHDEYAISRSRDFYWKLMNPYFTCISSRLLESKFHFDAKSTPFTDLLFRF